MMTSDFMILPLREVSVKSGEAHSQESERKGLLPKGKGRAMDEWGKPHD